MAFCPNCGSSVDGRFCAKCGAAVPVGGPAAGAGPSPGGAGPAPGYAPGPGPAPAPVATAGGMSDNVASALCYVLGLLTGILFLVIAPYNQNRTVKFHAFQSIFFNLAWIGIWIAVMIVSLILGAIPVLGWILSFILHIAILIGGFIAWLYLMYKAYNNEMVLLPVIGALAQKQANS